MLTHMTTTEERPFYIATIISVEAISLALGAILGGIITETSSYKICFVPNFPMGAISGFLGFYYFRPSAKTISKHTSWKDTIKSYDPVGCFLFFATILLLLLGLQMGTKTNNWTSPTVVVILVFSGLMLIGFVLQQMYTDQTTVMLPKGVIKREVILALAMGFFILGASQLTSRYLALYFEVRALLLKILYPSIVVML